ncbi:MAG: type I-B CRISPR-associated protein Cas5b [Lachnospiraceae bacterium]
MQILKFTLSGNTAFFKKPDVNTYLYFTYGHIHKLALMGIFGAVMGYGGYNQMGREDVFPEFYRRLKDIKIAIVPKNEKGMIHRKIQSFNNSVGYASYEQGGNLIVKEQWLEHPEWDIYVLLERDEEKKLAQAIINHQCTYLPYLGKNDHPADIKNPGLIEDAVEAQKVRFIDSLVPKAWVSLDYLDEEEEAVGMIFKYEEHLPVSLDEETNLYHLENFVYSNMYVLTKKCPVICAQGINLVFF